jgi:hypothetical protein
MSFEDKTELFATVMIAMGIICAIVIGSLK